MKFCKRLFAQKLAQNKNSARLTARRIQPCRSSTRCNEFLQTMLKRFTRPSRHLDFHLVKSKKCVLQISSQSSNLKFLKSLDQPLHKLKLIYKNFIMSGLLSGSRDMKKYSFFLAPRARSTSTPRGPTRWRSRPGSPSRWQTSATATSGTPGAHTRESELKTFQAVPNSFFTLLEEQVRTGIKRLKNRLP